MAKNAVTNEKLIRFCRARPADCSCGGCKYWDYCNAFHQKNGCLPIRMKPEEESEEFLEEEIIIRKRRSKA
ncbi:MAG: hypothetical protein Q4A32_03460 [Lachnospiraceae bacterium]|nr:hypothetical protein [Lachnospiraceae bacterium]